MTQTARQKVYEQLLHRVAPASESDLARIPLPIRGTVPLLLPSLMSPPPPPHSSNDDSNVESVSSHRTPSKIMTMIYVLHQQRQEVLLGYKTRGFGAGNWNAFGGKVERGTDRTIVEAAHRELEEESGLRLRDAESSLIPVGVLFFAYPDVTITEPQQQPTIGNCLYLEVHVFVVYADDEPFVKGYDVAKASEEMNPVKFVPFHELPLEAMWRDDPYWLPQLLERVAARPLQQEGKNKNEDHATACAAPLASSTAPLQIAKGEEDTAPVLWFALYCQFFERDNVQFVATCPVGLDDLLSIQREYEQHRR